MLIAAQGDDVILYLLQATQPIVDSANQWTPAAVTNLLVSVGGIIIAVIGAFKAVAAKTTADLNTGSIGRVASRVHEVAMSMTPANAPFAPSEATPEVPPLTTLTQVPPPVQTQTFHPIKLPR